VATKSLADDEALIAPTFNTAQTITDANKATANNLNVATLSSVTATGFAAGELVFIRVGRDPASVNDTLAATAVLIGVEITLRRSI
jgi:hypothetical protein